MLPKGRRLIFLHCFVYEMNSAKLRVNSEATKPIDALILCVKSPDRCLSTGSCTVVSGSVSSVDRWTAEIIAKDINEKGKTAKLMILTWNTYWTDDGNVRQGRGCEACSSTGVLESSVSA